MKHNPWLCSSKFVWKILLTALELMSPHAAAAAACRHYSLIKTQETHKLKADPPL